MPQKDAATPYVYTSPAEWLEGGQQSGYAMVGQMVFLMIRDEMQSVINSTNLPAHTSKSPMTTCLPTTRQDI